MPIKHAAIKDLRKNRKHATHNLRMKTHVKSLEHQLVALIKAGGEKDAVDLMKKLQQAAAKAEKNHVLHPNKSRRTISKAHKTLATIK